MRPTPCTRSLARVDAIPTFEIAAFALAVFALASVCSAESALAQQSVQGDSKPNIVFIFADDQTFASIGELGNADIETPNLDRLARRGTTFTHAFNMGSWSGAVCVASRTMLNSGRFLWDAHSIYDQSEQERREGRWWSEYMKAAGYRTYMTGKWHCKADAEAAFDVAKDIRPGMPKDTPAAYDRPRTSESDSWSPSDPTFGGFWEGGTHWSEVVANHADEFLDEAAARSEPFFMYLAFNAPHDPRQSPERYVAKYPIENVKVPASFLPMYPYANEMGCDKSLRDEKLAPFPRTAHSIQVHRQEYYAIITHMDEMIGRILDAVESTGKADNTWIFFTADHGLSVGHHGLLGKQNMYDDSVRVPLIVTGPGVKANERNGQPVYLQDVMPTTLQLAGVEQPKHVQFHSLLPLLEGGKSSYDAIYGAYLDKQRSIRSDTHKLIVYPKAKVLRLFDLNSDPLEMHDVASDPAAKPTLESLFEKLVAKQTELHDSLNLTVLRP